MTTCPKCGASEWDANGTLCANCGLMLPLGVFGLNRKKPEDCPVWEKIKARWPVVNPKTICIAYYPELYCARDLDPDFLAHEQVHLKQQERMGVENWWNLYLNDASFLLAQETEAYRVQGEVIRAKWRDRNMAARRIHLIAQDFSGDIYGRVITYEKAKAILNGQ